MKERPILFSGPMIRAILDGQKTVTRRIVRGVDHSDVDTWADGGGAVWEGGAWVDGNVGMTARVRCPFGVSGDRLWVKETWYDDLHDEPGPRHRADDGSVHGIEYRASHDCRSWESGCPCNPDGDGKRSAWRPSIFMPRWASRLTLEVVSVRVERLHEITNDDAEEEGVDLIPCDCERCKTSSGVCVLGQGSYREAFAKKWDEINGKRAPWGSNPFVWRVEFKVAK